MSAERFEITLSDDGLIHISGSNGRRASLITPDGIIGYVTHGAIRQQARDIKLLTQMLHDQRLVIDDLERRRVKVCDENDQLRTDLAAAVARAEQAEARLAAIEVAPMVARVVEIKRDFASGPYRCLYYDSDKLPGGFVELIARPAKD